MTSTIAPSLFPEPAAALSPEKEPACVVFAFSERDEDFFFREKRGSLPADLLSISRWTCDEDLLDPERWKKLLKAWRPEILVTCWSTAPLPLDWIANADCPLRYVCHLAGEVRKFVPRAFLERGGRVTNWGTMAGREVAEHALLLAMAALRKMPAWRRIPWTMHGPVPTAQLRTRTLYGRRVGLHGFGNVARALVELLKPFGVEICAFSGGVPDAFMQSHGVHPCGSLEELFARSEVLFECEALTPKTARSVNGRVLAALPDGAVFVNVGRGRVVDEPALLHEVRQGRIRAALDVVSEEPVSEQSEVMRVPGLVVSPHIGGPTPDRFPLCGRFALQNLRNYFNGEPLEALVTLEIFDRST